MSKLSSNSMEISLFSHAKFDSLSLRFRRKWVLKCHQRPFRIPPSTHTKANSCDKYAQDTRKIVSCTAVMNPDLNISVYS